MTTDCPLRLAVVAAIIDNDSRGDDDPLGSVAARLGSERRSSAESVPVDAATPAERALAQALRGDGQRGRPFADHTIAELLLLADDDPAADKLADGLGDALLPRAGSRPALARDERRFAFADIYRRLALHELDSQVRNKAAAILARLGAPRRRTVESHAVNGGLNAVAVLAAGLANGRRSAR